MTTSTSTRAPTARSTTSLPTGPTGRRGARASMPTSATGTSATRRSGVGGGRARGFTLIEILVVVAIIAIISVGVLLSVNLTGRDRDLETESNRLYTLFNYAREQAELQTREYGVRFDDDGYEFLTYDNHQG